MRGKKVDSEFLSGFISKCVGQNKVAQEDIVKAARQEIAAIDAQIIEVEKLKVTRSKLLDVVNTFEKPHASHKEEAKILSFFRMQHPKICKYICDLLRKETIRVDHLHSLEFSVADIVFCVKQLQEYKVIARMGDYLIRGDKFDEYAKFVLCEV
jgi:hypothetical protein